MNIFYLDHDAQVAASYLCDKHVPKMILESAQMLCSAHHFHGTAEEWMYKAAYTHHPSTKWVAQSSDHFQWLLVHAKHICHEYTRRFGKVHKTQAILDRLQKAGEPVGFVEPPQCMPDQYKDLSTVHAYRSYYLGDKARFAKWQKGTPAPWWWITNELTTSAA